MDHFIPVKTIDPNINPINPDHEKILKKYPHTVSCLEISPDLDFKIHLANDRSCIERSTKVFEHIKSIIVQKQYALKETKYIFHSKSDAQNFEEENLYILSHSRTIGNKTNILWPLVTHDVVENIFPVDLKWYLNCPDSIPWDAKQHGFIFRGYNSGIFSDCNSFPWQSKEKRSRIALLKEYIRLPDNLKQVGDVGFCHISDIKRNIDNVEYWTHRFGSFLKPECTIQDVMNDARLILEFEKPAVPINYFFNYKFILCPEGYDVSSSMNWVLASNCIAICPPFYHENFIINSKELAPFVHFLPIQDDYSDLGDIIQWGLSHPDECNQIVKNANAYMQ